MVDASDRDKALQLIGFVRGEDLKEEVRALDWFKEKE